jgi:hypothetical protein
MADATSRACLRPNSVSGSVIGVVVKIRVTFPALSPCRTSTNLPMLSLFSPTRALGGILPTSKD